MLIYSSLVYSCDQIPKKQLMGGAEGTGQDGMGRDGTGFCLKVEEETTHCGRDVRAVVASGDSLHCSHEQEVEEEQEEQEVEPG